MDQKVSNENSQPQCFVIMPISDMQGYEAGHFNRVYEHLLKPAITAAGFNPIRADDTNKTDYIVVSIIQQLVSSDMVLCDYSGRNPNVMYELGIRHAFDLPVTLIRDKRTEKVFDIQGLRYNDYDESLRIDTVERDILQISRAIKETSEPNSNAINSVIQLANIKPAVMPAERHLSSDSQIIMTAISALERKIELSQKRTGETFFTIADGKVVFSDFSVAEIGSDVFDAKSNHLGSIVDIHPSEEKIFVQEIGGKITPYYARSVKSRGLSNFPF